MKTHHEEKLAEDDCEDEDDDSNDEWSGDSHEYQCSSKHRMLCAHQNDIPENDSVSSGHVNCIDPG
jgi:hypothetical protein